MSLPGRSHLVQVKRIWKLISAFGGLFPGSWSLCLLWAHLCRHHDSIQREDLGRLANPGRVCLLLNLSHLNLGRETSLGLSIAVILYAALRISLFLMFSCSSYSYMNLPLTPKNKGNQLHILDCSPTPERCGLVNSVPCGHRFHLFRNDSLAPMCTPWRKLTGLSPFWGHSLLYQETFLYTELLNPPNAHLCPSARDSGGPLFSTPLTAKSPNLACHSDNLEKKLECTHWRWRGFRADGSWSHECSTGENEPDF